MPDLGAPEEPARSGPTIAVPKSLRNLVIATIVAAVVCAQIGTAFAPTLIVEHPLGMLSLNSANRYLFLVVNQIDAPAYYAVALLRRVAPAIAFFAIGYWYGDRAITWVENRDPSAKKMIQVAERIFDRATWLVVALFPIPIITLLVGARRPRPRLVFALITVTIALRLVLYRMIGSALTDPIDAVVGWIDRWRIPLMVVTFSSMAIIAWTQRDARAESLEELASLDDDDTVDDPGPLT